MAPRLASMGLYEVVEALLLMTNAVAILNEDRFLAPCMTNFHSFASLIALALHDPRGY